MDPDIPTELMAQINSGNLPAPDANTVYMVHLPPGVSVSLTYPDNSVVTSCQDFCAYHYYQGGIVYGVLPDLSTPGCAPAGGRCNQGYGCCGNISAFVSLTTAASHELMEAITDPQPISHPGWVQSGLVVNNEIGDLCAFAGDGLIAPLADNAYTSIVGPDGKTYTAQKGFSNDAYAANIGSPRGCVGYPTTLCCDNSQTTCRWITNGEATCALPTSISPPLSVGIPTLDGRGSATLNYSPNCELPGLDVLFVSMNNEMACVAPNVSAKQVGQPYLCTSPNYAIAVYSCQKAIDTGSGWTCPAGTSLQVNPPQNPVCCSQPSVNDPDGGPFLTPGGCVTAPGPAGVAAPALGGRATALLAGLMAAVGGLALARGRKRPSGRRLVGR
jgi:hypothetical protein